MPCAPVPGSMAGLLECGARLWGTLLRRRPTVCAALFLKKTTRRVDTAVACSYGKDSALGHLLGVSRGQETPAALGQHPPPVSFHKAEQDCLLVHRPDQPENPKVLRVAIIGAPNAGKSTLSNELLGRKVFPVSKKVHTTRCQAQGVITDADTQVILLDTPGLTTKVKVKRHNLETSLLQDPWRSMKSANVVLVLVDISDSWTCYNLHPEVLKCLSKFPELPSILVMNKVDLVKKKGILLDLVEALTEGFVNGKKLRVKSLLKPLLRARQEETSQPAPLVSGLEVDVGAEEPGEDVCGVQGEYTLGKQVDSDSVYVTGDTQEPQAAEKQMLKKPKARKGWPCFQEVFMLSAVSGEEVDTLKRYLLTLAKPSPWEFHSDVVTTQSPQEICNNIIRSKLLDHLPQEVPYNVTQTIELWEEGPGGELVILQKLLVQKERHVKMLIGQGGQVISKIAQEAGDELMNIFLCDVRLKLSVKMKK